MGYARDVLERRRNLEMELEAIRRQMDKIAQVGGCRGSMPKIEKVPGRNDYTYALRGTNNPEGAEIQHLDGYEEALRRHVAKNEGLMIEAERLIGMVNDGIDRRILRDYYCLGMTLRRIASGIHYDHTTVWRRWTLSLDELDCANATLATKSNNQQQTKVL